LLKNMGIYHVDLIDVPDELVGSSRGSDDTRGWNKIIAIIDNRGRFTNDSDIVISNSSIDLGVTVTRSNENTCRED
jgi:hypothetical protein